MAQTFDDLVGLQLEADEAHTRVLELRDAFGRPASGPWSEEQTAAYEEAWRQWRERAWKTQAAVTAFAKDENRPRYEVEADLRKRARHPEPQAA
ncbi:hypothetical protein [Streptomyces chartreusis]|uniref:Uncharacterized protein n=1 Tax=Streptomyces chartreusis TaxID=1969 RepID=A0A7H8TBH5_STRCX|nr:hypothetical protein [Streptomyces chartreusis]QKZ20348.1 hypothetical protein HUT05_25150 [Streptomyces chartreusis]